MDINIIDAHTHVHFPEFDGDRNAVIERAQKKGIGMITVGTDIALTKKAIDVAREYDGIWATAGIHPHEAKTYANNKEMEVQIQELEKLAQAEKVVGIGECGIDLFRQDDQDALEMQKQLFIAQLELAHRLKKPIVIHSRGSQNGNTDGLEMILDILEKRQSLLHAESVCHFFTGTKEVADRFLALGFSFTFGGLLTFNREFDDVVGHIPLERIMIETDAPFVTPTPHRGERNEPSYIAHTLDSLSEILLKDVEEVRRTLKENTLRVFAL